VAVFPARRAISRSSPSAILDIVVRGEGEAEEDVLEAVGLLEREGAAVDLGVEARASTKRRGPRGSAVEGFVVSIRRGEGGVVVEDGPPGRAAEVAARVSGADGPRGVGGGRA
jgi:hypothetical protein